jgi:hypothetical protein
LIWRGPNKAQFGADAEEGFARVQNVIHQQHVASADIQAQFLGEDQVGRFRPAAVAGDADEIQAQGQRKPAEQIGQKDDRAVQERDDDQIAPGKILFNLPGQGADAAGDAFLGDENGLNLLAPVRGRLFGTACHVFLGPACPCLDFTRKV